jgi:hypothetical protein
VRGATLTCGRAELPALCWKQNWQPKFLMQDSRILPSPGAATCFEMRRNKPLLLRLARWA